MRMKNLEKLKIGGTGTRMQLGIPLPRTLEGRVYRYSHPRHFVLGNPIEGFAAPADLSPRMTHMPRTPGTVCPYSGITEDDQSFTHPDDIEAAKQIVAHAAAADVRETSTTCSKTWRATTPAASTLRSRPDRGPRRHPSRVLAGAIYCVSSFVTSAVATTVSLPFHCSARTAARPISTCISPVRRPLSGNR
jgi:hypothetical protein